MDIILHECAIGKGSDPVGTVADKDGNAGLIRWGIDQ